MKITLNEIENHLADYSQKSIINAIYEYNKTYGYDILNESYEPYEWEEILYDLEEFIEMNELDEIEVKNDQKWIEETEKLKADIMAKTKEFKNMAKTKMQAKEEIDVSEDNGIVIKPEMKQYKELFDDSLFDEAFILLEKNVKNMDDIIVKNKHIRDFFGFIFEEVFFSELFDNKKLLPLSSSFVANLINKEVLKDMGAKLGNFVEPEMIGIMFSLLLQNKEFDKAEFLMPFFIPNVAEFPNTLNEVLSSNNINALRFICEKMNNIHYNEGSLLRMSSDMSPSALKMLIEEFNFDINEQSKETGDNLITVLIKEKNIKNFKFIYENYSSKINFSVVSGKKKTSSMMDLIESSGMGVDFIDVILDDLNLKPAQIERISEALFRNVETMNECLKTGIYDKLFAHPKFEHHTINFGQKYFVYGIMSKLGTAATKENEGVASIYLKVLESYLLNHQEDNIPDSTEYHVVGAAILIATVSGSKVAVDAAGLVMRRYPQHINRVNPNGKLPINQVEKDSPLYRLLINQGAEPLPEEQSFWSKLTGKKVTQPTYKKPLSNEEKEMEDKIMNSSGEPGYPIGKTRIAVEIGFKGLKPLLNHNMCDPRIKLKCENMFLTTKKLLNFMEEKKVQNAFEELNFLEDNIGKHLKKTLEYYIDVCNNASNTFSESAKEKKIDDAFKKCNDLVGLLFEQVILLSENVLNNIEQNALTNFRVQERFLTEKFKTSLPSKEDKNNSIIDVEKTGVQFKDLSKIIDINTTPESSQQLNLDLSAEEEEKEIGAVNIKKPRF